MRVVSVNVGKVRTFELNGRTKRSGIWKDPVAGRVRVTTKLEGDAQAARKIHGGPDKAVYAYALEDYAWWEEELGRSLDPGTFGENLTTEGLDLNVSEAGERWSVGTTVLEVTQPRTPCFKLGVRMDDPTFPERFGRAGRLGRYLRIVVPGDVGAGDAIAVL